MIASQVVDPRYTGTALTTQTAVGFLLTVVNGLAFERALPGACARIGFEANTLKTAVSAVLSDS